MEGRVDIASNQVERYLRGLTAYQMFSSVRKYLNVKYPFYVGKSISELQIQVATYVFELSAGNCHRQMATLSSFIVTRNDRYAHDCRDGAAVTRWRRPSIRVPRQNSVVLCGFCREKKYGSKGYPQRNAAHVR